MAAAPSDLEKFLGQKSILIVEGSQNLKASISQVLGQLGVTGSQMMLASDYREAMAYGDRLKSVALLITDYLIGDRSGVELAEEVFAEQDQLHKIAGLVLTGSAHQSNVVEAAEGLIDAYLLKPFSADGFKKYLLRVLEKKMSPKEEDAHLSEIRSLIRAEKYENAIQAIDLAFVLYQPAKPMIYHVYRGKAYEGLSRFGEARKSYEAALAIQEKNYLALFGVFNIYRTQGQKQEAYSCLKRISQLFPLSPQRLCDALLLAIETKNFNDVENYYQLFLTVDERRPDLIKTMNAALVVGAIHQLQQNRAPTGIELFRKAIMTSRRNPQVIYRAILYCLAYGQFDQVTEFFNRFEASDQGSPFYLFSKFLVEDLAKKGADIEQNLAKAAPLLQMKDCPIQVFRVVIKRSGELKKDRIQREAIDLAQGRWSTKYIEADLYYMSDEEEKAKKS
jgi:CheY-like chemotaxis protein